MCSIMGYCGAGIEGEDFRKALEKTHSRGPDDSRIVNTKRGWLGFNRLSIMGLTPEGMQPFVSGNRSTYRTESDITDAGELEKYGEDKVLLVCNGEIYGFRTLKEELMDKGYSFISD